MFFQFLVNLFKKQPVSAETAVQKTFNKVIDNGYYPADIDGGYMCIALDHAYIDGLISKKEASAAKAEIKQYLNTLRNKSSNYHHLNTLRNCLRRVGYDAPVQVMTAIYRNWKERPFK